MSLIFECECGETLPGTLDDVGKKVTCPACGAALVLAPRAILLSEDGSSATSRPEDNVIARPCPRRHFGLAPQLPDIDHRPSTQPKGADGRGPASYPRTPAQLYQAGLRAWQETRAVSTAAWAQSSRLLSFFYAFLRARQLKAAAEDAKLALGQRAYLSGLGDRSLRDRTGCLDEEIRKAGTEGRVTAALKRERKQRLVEIATSLLERPTTVLSTGDDFRAAQDACKIAHQQEALVRDRKASIFPRDARERRRVAIGYALFSAALVIIVLCLRAGVAGRQTSFRRISLVASDRAADRERGIELSSGTESAKTPVTPGGAITPEPLLSDVPNFDKDDERIVMALLGTISDFYKADGFKEYRLGVAKADIPIVGKSPHYPAWMITKDHTHLMFSDTDQLIAVGRIYEGNNEANLEGLRDLFGPADPQEMEKFHLTSDFYNTASSSVRTPVMNYVHVVGSVEDVLRITYRFPKTIAVVRVGYGTNLSSDGRSSTSDSVAVSVYDASWARTKLSEDIRAKRHAVQWFRDVIDVAMMVGPDEQRLPQYDASVREAKRAGYYKSLFYRANARSHDPSRSDEHGKRRPGWFCAVTEAIERMPDEPKGTVRGTLRFSLVPDVPENQLLSTTLFHKVVRANSALVQECFPPKGGTISVLKEKGDTVEAFEWITKENFKVRVTAQNTVTVTKLVPGL